MASKIVKSTSKGQITLPMEWRKKFETNTYIMQIETGQITVTPLNLKKMEEEILFDADRDNEGTGVSVDDMISRLKKIKNG